MSTSDIALTAPNQFVEGANGVTYAYRRFGTASPGVPPLVMLQHFRGNLDNWDPLLLGALASHREVIPVDNAGVGLSSGAVPPTITGMARDALTFIEALGLPRIDLLPRRGSCSGRCCGMPFRCCARPAWRKPAGKQRPRADRPSWTYARTPADGCMCDWPRCRTAWPCASPTSAAPGTCKPTRPPPRALPSNAPCASWS
ncbi:alpha/beta hydrolase [Streptomyces sp. NBC_01549]|uniref:alpha/beta fold hydrolase n=1 Tax=Streptomyces sp. NBC_01549 TaxID=2975874 RepID=UPI002254C350|nr:alpha/beta hydrolase [Streptomyces sp. NBC_01549]MCX4594313.1 alpha/beta hydrolase [Streptomyces sp. NBC_01549]